MEIKNLIEYFRSNPKRLFLIDAVGAFLSAFLLGFVLIRFEKFFGIPKPTLYFLAVFPILFSFFDFYCILKVKNSIGKYLKHIAMLNLFYCCVSIGAALLHFSEITFLGFCSIFVEILIISALVYLEFKVANLNFERPTL